jgi:putative restriction endonuclease
MSTGQASEHKNLAYYCKRFSELNVSSSRQRGKANYKPILLLSVVDLISQGLIQDNQIPVSNELIETFNKYWDILGSASYNGGLHYPFIHLRSEGFWHITPKAGWNGPKPKTNNKVREAVEYASLDDELFNLLQEPMSRTELIDTLVAVWFSGSRKEIEEILQINQDFQDSTFEEIEDLGKLDKPTKAIFKKSLVRNAFFRKAVVHTYNYRCVFCKLKVTRALNQNIVDGAHIKPFSQFYDSKINNGISLCKNHHWAFDMGWFSIDDEYRILVASDLQEESPNARPMQDFRNEQIILPNSEKYFPSLEALQWHRSNIFKA